MSGEWIKLRVDLADDPAVIAISAATRLCADEVIGKLYRLWAWADRHTRDGRAPGVGSQWVDEYARKRGFAAAMARAGWLEVTDAGIVVPHFERHNGEPAKARALDKSRKQFERASGSRPDIPPDQRRTTVRKETGQNPDEPRTREEKRREEQKQEQRRATTVALPPDFVVSDRVRRWAADKGYGKLEARLEHFIGKAKAKGYKYVDWDEAFMGAIRDDWAGLDDGPRSTAQPSKQVAL